MRRTILTVVLNLDKGGTQRTAQNFAAAYKILGYRSEILAVSGGGVRVVELREMGIEPMVGLSENEKSLVDLCPDVVHLHSHGISAQEIEKIRALSPNAEFLETNVFSRPTPAEEFLRFSFQLSQWCEFLYLHRGGNPDKSRVLPNAVRCETLYLDPKAKFEFRKRFGISQEAFVVGRVGQSIDRKWSVTLLDSFEFLCKERQDCLLVICNPPEDITAEIASRPEVRKRTQIIERLVGDEELRGFYNSIDVMLHVADVGESFGMVLAESLLCQTPVLTLNTPWGDNSQGEVLGPCGNFWAANTVIELMTALREIYDLPEYSRKLMAADGRNYVLQNYEMVHVAGQALAYLENDNSDKSGISGILKFAPKGILSVTLIYLMRYSRSAKIANLARGYFMKRAGIPKSSVSRIPAML